MTWCRCLLVMVVLAGCGRRSPGPTIGPEPARIGATVVTGVVHEAQTDRRVPNVQVAARDESRGRTFITRTADDGLYVLTGLDPGTYVVQVQGFTPRRTVTTRSGLDRFRADFTVEREESTPPSTIFAPTATLAGVVTHRDTQARLPDAMVILRSPALPEVRETQTDRNGLFAFRELPAGTYTVMVLVGNSEAHQSLTLTEQSRSRANFAVAPESTRGCFVLRPSDRLDASMFSIEREEARRLGLPTTTIYH